MRREWIEIDYYMKMVDGKECLPPCGGSGLKFLWKLSRQLECNVSLHAEGVD